MNNANIISTFHQPQVNIEFVVIDRMFTDTMRSLFDVLQSRSNLSIMNTIVKASTMEHLLTLKSLPKEICFDGDLCVRVSESMTSQFFNLITAKQFTFQFLENEAFDVDTGNNKLNKILKSAKSTNDFVSRHIFFGMHDNELDNERKTRVLGVSLKEKHPVAEFLRSPDDDVDVTRNGKKSYVIKESIRVKEGLVQILRPIN